MDTEDRSQDLRCMQICRFCFADNVELTSIYEKHNKDGRHSVPLPLQIMACLAIEVFANDGMPELICNKCRSQTLQAYVFKTNCKKADDAFKLYLATGKLMKPHLKEIPLEEPQRKLTGKQITKSIIKERNDPKDKKIKLETPEVITLNFDQSSGEQIVEVGQGENEDECILGLGDDINQPEESKDYEMEDASNINPVLKVNQVATAVFPCPHCERTFPLKQLLELHVVNHDRERSFECDECNRKFFTKYDLNKHYQTHMGVKPFNCVVCQKSFSRESLLHRHEKIHVDVPKYLCTQCDKTFLTKQNLDAHVDKHKKKRPYTCKTCNKSFVFKQGLERHELVHSEDKPHKCNYCEASFNSAIKLTRHITTHAGLRPYPCKLCGRTFLLSHHLSRHMRSHYAAMSSEPHDIIGQYKCDICSMSFRRKDFLINHSAIHSMVNLRCVICNTKFENAKIIKEHITTHLSDLPYPCEKCDYSFDTQEQLEEHELKHAEMEYEEQIEKEVVAEALQHETTELQVTSDFEENDIDEFTLTNDLENPEVIRRTKVSKNYAEFLKDELGSDLEESNENEEQAAPELEEVEPIKPIVRSEGTKVYTRKSANANTFKKIQETTIINSTALKMAPLEQITQPESCEDMGLTTETINALPHQKVVNMKLGDKVVRVQKFIVTKDEMKAMAKKGILEMKGGTVVLKNPGHPILNATLKAIQPSELDAIIDKDNRSQIKRKTYQRKIIQEENREYLGNSQDIQEINVEESSSNL